MGAELVDLAHSFLSLVIPVIAVMTVEALRRYIGLQRAAQINEAIITKEKLALTAVRFVEQAYKDLQGDHKYNLAAAWLAEQVNQHGFSISHAEIKGLIEAALRQLKDEFSAEWHKQLL